MSRNPAPGGHVHRSFSWIWLAALAGSPSLAEPPKPPSAAQLIESLANPDFYERQRAMDGLAAHRAASESLAPALREKLRAKDQEVRQRAAMALAALGVGEAPVIDELQEALNDPAAAEEAARSLKVIEVARRQPRASPLLTRGVTPGRTAAGESGAGASLRPPPTGLEVRSHLGGASRLCRDRNRQK